MAVLVLNRDADKLLMDEKSYLSYLLHVFVFLTFKFRFFAFAELRSVLIVMFVALLL